MSAPMPPFSFPPSPPCSNSLGGNWRFGLLPFPVLSSSLIIELGGERGRGERLPGRLLHSPPQRAPNVAYRLPLPRRRPRIHDHASGLRGGGRGIWVRADAKDTTTVRADCVFARNEVGDLVRSAFAADAPPEMAALCGEPQAPRPAVHAHALAYSQAGLKKNYCDACGDNNTLKSGAYQCDECGFAACISCFNK